MRKILLAVWVLLPIGGWAYHAGPGQDRLAADDAADLLAKADQAAHDERWPEAESLYGDALGKLPEGHVAEARRIRLERAKAQMLASKLPTARADLEDLVGEMQKDADADPALLADARDALAQSEYYMTYLMRLEGLSPDEWQPEIDSARQLYGMLAETAAKSGDHAAAKRHQDDLESAIRLARMDIKDLQGLPLPSQ